MNTSFIKERATNSIGIFVYWLGWVSCWRWQIYCSEYWQPWSPSLFIDGQGWVIITSVTMSRHSLQNHSHQDRGSTGTILWFFKRSTVTCIFFTDFYYVSQSQDLVKKPELKKRNCLYRNRYQILDGNYSSARSVNTIDPEMREILILTFCPGLAFATYMI